MSPGHNKPVCVFNSFVFFCRSSVCVFVIHEILWVLHACAIAIVICVVFVPLHFSSSSFLFVSISSLSLWFDFIFVALVPGVGVVSSRGSPSSSLLSQCQVVLWAVLIFF